jgi:hypothetical protein
MAVFYLGTGSDDGRWSASNYSNTAYYQIVGDASGTDYHAFFRFPNITIPKNAVITAANLTVKANSTLSNSDCIINIKAIAEDNPTAPTDKDDADSRSLTSAYSSWTLPAFTSGESYTSGGINNVIQEIVKRSGWSSGNALCLTMKGNSSDYNASRRIDSYEANATALYLTVTWEGEEEEPPAATFIPRVTMF